MQEIATRPSTLIGPEVGGGSQGSSRRLLQRERRRSPSSNGRTEGSQETPKSLEEVPGESSSETTAEISSGTTAERLALRSED